jgi:5-methylcytosine-specific restriction protein A
LNALPIHLDRPDAERFRNPNGVSMKLGHFLHVDPQYPGKGLDGCSRLDREVFNEFAGDLPRLTEITTAIKVAANAPDCLQIHLKSSNDEECPVEGHILLRLHLERERNPRIVARKKAFCLLMHSRLACEVCEFDFHAFYGPDGAGYIECHHIRPLATAMPIARTRLSDLALVCSNCHRILHRGRSVISVSDLRETVSRQRAAGGDTGKTGAI